MVTKEDIFEALEQVNDPHVPVSLNSMGMLRDAEVSSDGKARIQLCIPCLGCPGVTMLHDNIKVDLLPLDGINEVIIEDGWHLSWSRDLVSDDVKNLMRENGIQI